jgi:hypothetical protein
MDLVLEMSSEDRGVYNSLPPVETAHDVYAGWPSPTDAARRSRRMTGRTDIRSEKHSPAPAAVLAGHNPSQVPTSR